MIMSASVLIGEPHLFGGERDLLERVLVHSKCYMEFGLGGSSLLAVRRHIPTIVAVESDPVWAETVRSHPEIAPRVAAGSMAVLGCDIGPVRDWGAPRDRAAINRWPAYLAAGWAEWDRRREAPDLVFVDGRFRVACCLSIVLATGAGRVVSPPQVLLHDVSEQRPTYQQVFEFFDVEQSENSLFLLRMRADANLMSALNQLLHRQFDHE
jgi:hypothetical protein